MTYSIEAKKQNPNVSIENQSNVRFKLNQLSFNLNAYSLQLTKNEFDANDLFQDTVLRIITNAEKFTSGSNFKAWAMTIMRNLFINNYRKKKRLKVIIDQTSNDSFANSSSQSVKNEAEIKIAYKEMIRMVDKLPDNFKYPFLMTLRGYQYKEIAEKLKVPIGTVKSRIFFARKTLQKNYIESNKILA